MTSLTLAEVSIEIMSSSKGKKLCNWIRNSLGLYSTRSVHVKFEISTHGNELSHLIFRNN